MNKKIDLGAEFEAAIGRFNAVRGGRYEFQIGTRIGALHVQFYDDESPWIAAIWDDPKAVAGCFGVKGLVSGDRLNPYTGKWNWHWFQYWPCDTKARRVDRVEAARKMITAFVDKVAALV